MIVLVKRKRTISKTFKSGFSANKFRIYQIAVDDANSFHLKVWVVFVDHAVNWALCPETGLQLRLKCNLVKNSGNDDDDDADDDE